MGLRFRRMEQAKRNGITPVHWQDLEQRMDISPVFNGHQNTIIVFTLVKYINIIKVKIYYVYLRMIFPQVFF